MAEHTTMTLKDLVAMLDHHGKHNGKHFITYKEVNELYKQKANGDCWAIVETDCVAIAKWRTDTHHIIKRLSVKDLLESAKREKIECAMKKKEIKGEVYQIEDLEREIPTGYPLEKGYEIFMNTGVAVDPKYVSTTTKTAGKERHEERVRIQGYQKLDMDDDWALGSALDKYPFTAGLYIESSFWELRDEIYFPRQIPDDFRRIVHETNDIIAARDRLRKAGVDPGPRPTTLGGFHSVLVVDSGYDPDEDLHFWVVKNTFGPAWGIEGFGRIVKRSSRDASCGPSLIRGCMPLL